jgi:hypothetical protein
MGSSANSLYEYGISGYTGDICNYIDGGWRMPNADELGFNGFGENSDYDCDFSDGSDPGDSDGTGSMGDAGAMYNSAFGHVFLPASGGRTSSGQALVGTHGYYWSGSQYYNAPSSYSCYDLEFYSSSAMGYIANGSAAFPIRCIKKLEGE